jgi:hypothetical protein
VNKTRRELHKQKNGEEKRCQKIVEKGGESEGDEKPKKRSTAIR